MNESAGRLYLFECSINGEDPNLWVLASYLFGLKTSKIDARGISISMDFYAQWHKGEKNA